MFVYLVYSLVVFGIIYFDEGDQFQKIIEKP